MTNLKQSFTIILLKTRRCIAKETILICGGMSCTFEFSDEIKFRLEEEITKRNIEDIEVESTSCIGLCDTSPIVRLVNKKKCYIKTNMEDLSSILEEAIS